MSHSRGGFPTVAGPTIPGKFTAGGARHVALCTLPSTTFGPLLYWTPFGGQYQRNILHYIRGLYWTTFGGLHWTTFGGPHWRTILYTGLHLEDYIGLHRNVLPTYHWQCCAIGVGGLCTAVKCPVIIGRFRTG